MKKKRKKRTEMDNPSPIEIRNHANGRLDEIVARGANAHLEQMDSNYWWMGLQLAGRHFHGAGGIGLQTEREAGDHIGHVGDQHHVGLPVRVVHRFELAAETLQRFFDDRFAARSALDEQPLRSLGRVRRRDQKLRHSDPL